MVGRFIFRHPPGGAGEGGSLAMSAGFVWKCSCHERMIDGAESVATFPERFMWISKCRTKKKNGCEAQICKACPCDAFKLRTALESDGRRERNKVVSASFVAGSVQQIRRLTLIVASEDEVNPIRSSCNVVSSYHVLSPEYIHKLSHSGLRALPRENALACDSLSRTVRRA